MGHFGYYGIAGDFASLQRYRWEVIEIWRNRLARQGDPDGIPRECMNRLLNLFYVPEVRVVHSIYAANP